MTLYGGSLYPVERVWETTSLLTFPFLFTTNRIIVAGSYGMFILQRSRRYVSRDLYVRISTLLFYSSVFRQTKLRVISLCFYKVVHIRPLATRLS